MLKLLAGKIPPLKPSEGVISTELKFQQDKVSHIVGRIEQAEDKYFARVDGRSFEILPWMTHEEALSNLHLEVPSKKYDSFFQPCTRIEFCYGVSDCDVGD